MGKYNEEEVFMTDGLTDLTKDYIKKGFEVHKSTNLPMWILEMSYKWNNESFKRSLNMDSKMSRCRSSMIFRNQKIIGDWSIKDIIHDHKKFIDNNNIKLIEVNELKMENG